MRTAVARELFLDRGARPRAPKSGTRNKGIRWNWNVFLSRKQAFSKKIKKVFAGFGAFSCPKNGSGYRSQGGKSRPWGAKIFPGGAAAPPTSRAYDCGLELVLELRLGLGLAEIRFQSNSLSSKCSRSDLISRSVATKKVGRK